MAKKESIYISIGELKDNIGNIEEDSGQKKIRFSNESRVIPHGTYFKIETTLLNNVVGDVGYISDRKIWYVLQGDKVLWSSYPITTSKSVLKSRSLKKSKTPKFNRFSALLGR